MQDCSRFLQIGSHILYITLTTVLHIILFIYVKVQDFISSLIIIVFILKKKVPIELRTTKFHDKILCYYFTYKQFTYIGSADSGKR